MSLLPSIMYYNRRPSMMMEKKQHVKLMLWGSIKYHTWCETKLYYFLLIAKCKIFSILVSLVLGIFF